MSTKTKWRNSKEWRKAKMLAKLRDNFKCTICTSGKQLQVHHIEDASYHPNERYKLRNLVTLCRKCHTQFHCNYKKSFRQKTTRDDWENFMCIVNYFKTTFSETKKVKKGKIHV